MHSHIGYICLAFLLCEFWNVPLNGLPGRMHSHIGYICLFFLLCVFSNVSSNHLPELMHNHTGCICLTFPQCVFSNVSSIFLPRLVYSRIGSIYLKKASQITCLLQFLIDPSPCSKTTFLTVSAAKYIPNSAFKLCLAWQDCASNTVQMASEQSAPEWDRGAASCTVFQLLQLSECVKDWSHSP